MGRLYHVHVPLLTQTGDVTVVNPPATYVCDYKYHVLASDVGQTWVQHSC